MIGAHYPAWDEGEIDCEYISLTPYDLLAYRNPELTHEEIIYMLPRPIDNSECPF